MISAEVLGSKRFSLEDFVILCNTAIFYTKYVAKFLELVYYFISTLFLKSLEKRNNASKGKNIFISSLYCCSQSRSVNVNKQYLFVNEVIFTAILYSVCVQISKALLHHIVLCGIFI